MRPAILSRGPSRSRRRSLPPLALSVLVHAVLLLLLPAIRPPAPEAPAGRQPVMLVPSPLRPQAAAGRRPAGRMDPLPRAAGPAPAEEALPRGLTPSQRPLPREVPLPAAFGGIPLPSRGAGAGPEARYRQAEPAGRNESEDARPVASIRRPERPARFEEPVVFPTPDFQAVLSPFGEAETAEVAPAGEDEAQRREAEGGAGRVPASPASPPPEAVALEAEEPQIGWNDRPRRLLVRRTPEFPQKLIQEGLEAEVVARFLVSPEGQVVQVELLQSSGYSLADASVIQALRGYSFDKSPVGRSDTGTIRFSFRLEREVD